MYRPRTPRAARRGVTLIEAGLVASAAAAAVTGLVLWMGPKSRAADQDQAQRDAAVILEAAETWQKRTDTSGCPSMSRLVQETVLPRAARLDDPWGERFRIECNDSGLTVWSPGADKKRGTSDDVRLLSQSD